MINKKVYTENFSPIVFHGSPEKFDQFDYKKIGTNGTSEGFGFYFTDSKKIAENYGNEGYIFSARLHGKALNGNKLTMKRSEYKKLIQFLDQEDEFLSNYGDKDFEGLTVVMNRAMQDYSSYESDSEVIGSLVNASGGTELVLNAVYNLLGYGYMIEHETNWGYGQKIYVALVNEVIEIVEINQYVRSV